MKSLDEIQKAHDVLIAVVLKEVDISMDNQGIDRCRSALDALCWVLDHDHNTAFAGNFASVHKAITEKGYVLNKEK